MRRSSQGTNADNWAFLMGCRRALRPEIDSVREGRNLLYDESHGAGREKIRKKSGCRLKVVSGQCRCGDWYGMLREGKLHELLDARLT